MPKIILALSGGLDSTVLLSSTKTLEYECETVSFFYGSKHNEYEIKAAQKIAQYYEVPWRLVNIEGVMKEFRSDLMLGGGEIPEGHYKDENMKRTVVPGRNIIFISILSGLAWSLNAEEVWIGIHAGDHAIYPDCRPKFYRYMRDAISAGTDSKVILRAPFLMLDKKCIVERGIINKVPFHFTRTCYKMQEKACGKCGSCIERLEAFSENGIKDSIEYEV